MFSGEYVREATFAEIADNLDKLIWIWYQYQSDQFINVPKELEKMVQEDNANLFI
jgi:hypothetical protein